MDAARYYSDLTVQYERYAGATHGWHYGVWEPDVRSHTAALLRSNELLLRGLSIGASTRILDVGFGIGGFTVWAAREFGAQMTAITVAADHVALARDLAAQQGVSALCDFRMMDMDALDFADASFDVVVNQETFCHAADKAGYLARVRRILKPGGVWRAVDFSVQDAPLDAVGQESYAAVCEGFHLPSMASASATADTSCARATCHG
jgi:cyclopropane fatty-acyl-phospholipid synthase-like methyltransferase